MKPIIPIGILCLCALGCNKFGPQAGSESNTAANANSAAPAAIKKVIDLPATIGKSKDEIKKMVNATPTHEEPWLEYDLPEASLTFKFGKDMKASDASFRFKAVTIGNSSISGASTAEQLATMAGVDIRGKTPTTTGSIADSYDQDINGRKMSIAIYHTDGTFDSVMITPK